MSGQGHEQYVIWAIAIFGAMLITRFTGLYWDDGLLLNPDERNIIGAALRLSFPGNLVPDFHAYNGLSVYAPRSLAEFFKWIGVTSKVTGSEVAIAARLLSACFSSLTIAIVLLSGPGVLGRHISLLYALLLTASPALIQSAHFGTTESALAMVVTVLIVVTAAYRRGAVALPSAALLCGLAIALGLAFKTTAAIFAILPIAGFLLPTNGDSFFRRFLWLSVAGTISICGLLISTPQIILKPADYFGTMRFEADVVSGAADVFWTYQFHDSQNVLFELSQLPWLLGPVGASLALPGLLLLFRQVAKGQSRGFALVPSLLFCVIYAAIVFSWHAKFVRYLVVLLPVLALASAAFLDAVKNGLRPAARSWILAALCTSIAISGIGQAMIYARIDPRVQAAAWLQVHLDPKRDILLVEPVEVSPPLATGPYLSNLHIEYLPLLEPSGAEKDKKLAKLIQAGTWMIILSRRHHRVLPSMRGRFPEMQEYYRKLWKGELGFEVVATFSRRNGLLDFYDPTAEAEETFSVFDSPTVFVLKKNH